MPIFKKSISNTKKLKVKVLKVGYSCQIVGLFVCLFTFCKFFLIINERTDLYYSFLSTNLQRKLEFLILSILKL